MEWWQGVLAGAGTAILEIQVQVGCPQGISDDLVEMDRAAVGNYGGLGRTFRFHPGDILHSSVDACPCHRGQVLACRGVVYQQGKLVLSAACGELRLEVEIMVLVVDVVRGLHIVFIQVDGVGALSVDSVLEIAAALDFPTAVDVAASHQGGGESGACNYGCKNAGWELHGPKLEIIFGIDD